MKYENVAICDLRNIVSVEQAKQITLISHVAAVIFPEDAPPELREALQMIPMEKVAGTMSLPRETVFSTVNGFGLISEGTVGKDTLLTVNGKAILYGLSPEKQLRLVVNGCVVLHESLRQHPGIQIIACNGTVGYVDFYPNVKTYSNIEVDAAMLHYIKPQTTLFTDEDMVIAPDVTAEMLEEKEIFFISGDGIICPAQAAGYVKAFSYADRIEVKG